MPVAKSPYVLSKPRFGRRCHSTRVVEEPELRLARDFADHLLPYTATPTWKPTTKAFFTFNIQTCREVQRMKMTTNGLATALPRPVPRTLATFVLPSQQWPWSPMMALRTW